MSDTRTENNTRECDHCSRESADLYLSFDLDAGWVCARCRDYHIDHGEFPDHREDLEAFV